MARWLTLHQRELTQFLGRTVVQRRRHESPHGNDGVLKTVTATSRSSSTPHAIRIYVRLLTSCLAAAHLNRRRAKDHQNAPNAQSECGVPRVS